MTDNGVILGIDTSNYTTSVGILSLSGDMIANIKLPLAVKAGERGLRQSDAVFAHVKNMPDAMAEAKKYLIDRQVLAVGVSVRPRNTEGSYMPCFLSGLATASGIGAVSDVPVFEFSHQCGHIMAALYSSGAEEQLLNDDFAAFHVSGGTTELLRVRFGDFGFHTEIVGGTLDLNAGQVIDRIGVHLGYKFPAGAALESCALSYNTDVRCKKVALKGTYANFSGLENIALTMLSRGKDASEIAAHTLCSIGDAIRDMSIAYIEKFGDMPFVYAGGVMCNSIIRSKIKETDIKAYFAELSMSSDNAVGIAELARRKYLKI